MNVMFLKRQIVNSTLSEPIVSTIKRRAMEIKIGKTLTFRDIIQINAYLRIRNLLLPKTIVPMLPTTL